MSHIAVKCDHSSGHRVEKPRMTMDVATQMGVPRRQEVGMTGDVGTISLWPVSLLPWSPRGRCHGLPYESPSNRVGDTLGMKSCFIALKWSLVTRAIFLKMGNGIGWV